MNSNISVPSPLTKARFIALYQFSHVCFEGISNSVWDILHGTVNGVFVENGNKGKIPVKDTSPLLLKSLENLTEEDSKKIPNKEYNGNIKYLSANEFKYLYELMGFLTQEEADVLRELGYCIPYQEYSVQDLVNFGWVKLI